MADSDFSFGGVSIPSSTKRLYVTAVLVPSTGDPRIQPTGFPDIGSVFYPDPSGEHGQICLIESEASMANRLEEVAFADKYTGTLVSELAGLPYIKIEKTEKGSNRFMTASTIDGHRFASEYIMKAKLKEASGEHHEHRPLPRRYHRRAHWLLWTIAQFAQSIALPFPSFGHSCHFGLGQFAAVDE